MKPIPFRTSPIRTILLLSILAPAGAYFFYQSGIERTLQHHIRSCFEQAQRFHNAGNHEQAKQMYYQLLAKDPHCIAAHFNIAQLYAAQKQWAQACTHYEQALQTTDIPADTQQCIQFCYGTALFRLNKLPQAVTQLTQALAFDYDPKILMQRSLVHLELGNLSEAKQDLDLVVQDEPSFASGYIKLGTAYRDTYDFMNAIACFQATVRFMPERAEGYRLLGDVLHLEGRRTGNRQYTKQAFEAYQKALVYNPHCHQTHTNLGLMHMEHNNDDTAQIHLDTACRLKPDFVNGHIARGICLLKTGKMPEGWHGYEWRTHDTQSRFAHIPAWDGKRSLKAKRIILHSEQGYGDTLHFIRYAREAKKHGAYVICELQERLKTLCSLLGYIDQVITPADPIPAADYQLPLLSMPTVLETTVSTIPNQIPYLSADPDLISTWRKRISHDSRFKVGICWRVDESHDFIKYSNSTCKLQVNSPHRSIDLTHLAPLFTLKDVSWYCLQFNADRNQCAAYGLTQFEDLDTMNGPFMDTAALMHSLDLIITVDTSLAHLAGGLGRPTWILLPWQAEWRWMKHRYDTPWYPTARLYRCPEPGGWEHLITEIKDALSAHISTLKGEAIARHVQLEYNEQ